uniref:Uncharacterized protein n=1 Tax=Anguilla anguilla TaxID=7936 RepID=A0A0E9SV17_ANGAN
MTRWHSPPTLPNALQDFCGLLANRINAPGNSSTTPFANSK